MKKKHIFGLIALSILALCAVVCMLCQKGGVSDIGSVVNLSPQEKQVVEDLLPLTGEVAMLPSPEKMETFQNLSEQQLEYFIVLQAQQRAHPQGRPDQGLSYEDVVALFDAQVRALNVLAKTHLHKPYNKISEAELHEFLSTYTLEIPYLMKENLSSQNQIQFLEDYERGWKSEEEKNNL